MLDALFGMGQLQSLIDDPDVENIDINGCDRVWATFADGSKRMMPAVADSDEELIELVRFAASRFGLSERRFDLARPELDLRLPDGSRLSALMAVTARPAVSIRRHRFSDLSLSDLHEMGSIDHGLESLLRSAVLARRNIVVSGAMNSGKTTLLRALASEIPPRERLVTIEQAFELGLDTPPHRHPDMVALEARQANMEGAGMVSVADLVRHALRMNADRVIVGEVLGDEVLPMLNAMSQGRSGSMCTIHGTHPPVCSGGSPPTRSKHRSGCLSKPATCCWPARSTLSCTSIPMCTTRQIEKKKKKKKKKGGGEVRSHDQGWPLAQCPEARKSISRHGSGSSISRLGRPEPGSSRPSGRWWMPTGCRSSPTRSTGLVPTAEQLGFAAAARDTPKIGHVRVRAARFGLPWRSDVTYAPALVCGLSFGLGVVGIAASWSEQRPNRSPDTPAVPDWSSTYERGFRGLDWRS